MDNRGKRQASSLFGGMGFYIALLVCVVAAGVVGYFALLNNNDAQTDPVQAVDQTDPGPAQSVSLPEQEPAKPVIAQEPIVAPKPAPQPDASEADAAPASVSDDTARPAADTAPAAVQDTEEVLAPLAGETVAVFSVDQLTYDATLGDWRTHDGIDIQAAAGSPVVATAAGTVLSVEEDGRLGTVVVVDHNNGYVTTYASLQPEVAVLAGDTVAAGDPLGAVGNTSLSEAGLGAHLHFSVTKDGQAVDPLNYLS